VVHEPPPFDPARGDVIARSHRPVIVFEPEELLVDTLPTRVAALKNALGAEGVDVSTATLLGQHAGSLAEDVLLSLPEAAHLDAVSRELVLHRGAQSVRVARGTAILRQCGMRFDRSARGRRASCSGHSRRTR
jgi:hypothetical protein